MRLGECELVRNPWVASSAVASVQGLGDTVCEILLLEQNDELLGRTREVLVPVCCQKGRITSTVEAAEVIILPCVGIIGRSLTLEKLIGDCHVVNVLYL